MKLGAYTRAAQVVLRLTRLVLGLLPSSMLAHARL